MSKDELKTKSNDELAMDRTSLAEQRTDLALDRTLLASERTYAAWIRTGFSIASGGIGLGTALRNTQSATVAVAMGSILILMGIFCFAYALYQFRTSFQRISDIYIDEEEKIKPFKDNAMWATLLIVVLVGVSLLGLYLMLNPNALNPA